MRSEISKISKKRIQDLKVKAKIELAGIAKIRLFQQGVNIDVSMVVSCLDIEMMPIEAAETHVHFHSKMGTVRTVPQGMTESEFGSALGEAIKGLSCTYDLEDVYWIPIEGTDISVLMCLGEIQAQQNYLMRILSTILDRIKKGIHSRKKRSALAECYRFGDGD